eukprot:15342922-Alexandrium_andersonii.AAC.1
MAESPIAKRRRTARLHPSVWLWCIAEACVYEVGADTQSCSWGRWPKRTKSCLRSLVSCAVG